MRIISGKLLFFYIIFCPNFLFAQLVANFSSDVTTGCGTAAVNFIDQSTGNPTSWLWDFGDGSTSTQQNPTHIYLTPGSYTVKLTATNIGGSDPETKTNYITVFPLPIADFSQDDTIGCIPFTVNFTDLSNSSPSNIVSWLWNFGDGNNSTQNNPSHTYTFPGTYSVSLFATDGNNCTGNKIKNGLITVLDSLNAKFTLNSNFSCIAPFDVNFTNTSSTGTGISYLWDFGDSSPTSSAQNPPAHTYTAFGNYIISLIISNTAGCTDTFLQTLSINSFSSDFAASDSSGCIPFTTGFSATNPSATSFTWTFPGGSPVSSSSGTPSVTYNSPGTYDVTLIAGNAQGCTDTLTIDDFITVFPLPVVNFSASDSNSCLAPFTVNYTPIAPGAASWTWTFTGGSPASSILENPSITYNAEGIYNVSLTVIDTNGCSKTTTANNFITISFPVSNFASTPIKGCQPLNVNFTDLSSATPPVNQWQWNFGDPASGANNTSASQNPLHTFNDTGIYDIQLIIINGEGCTDTIVKNDFVMVGMLPTADFIPKDTIGCHPFTVPFTNFSSAYTDEWLWTFTNGITTYNSNSFSPTQTFSDTGFFDITLIALHHGCPDTLFVDNAIFVKPAKPIFTASPTIFCEKNIPYEVTFTDASIGAEDWIWKFGDGSPDATGQGPQTHTYLTPGFFTAWLVVQNFTTVCIDSISALISISQIDVGFSTDTISGCQPLSITFSDSSTTNNSIVTKMWMFGDGINTPPGTGSNNITGVSNTSGTFSIPNHIFSGSGFYNVSLIITDLLGCSDTLTVDSLIDVKPLPVADFTSDTANGCAPLIIQFSDNTASASSIKKWDWDFGNTNTDTLQNPADTFIIRGQYTVRLIVTDTFNCVDTIVKTNYINATFPFTNFTIANDTICNFNPGTFLNSSTGSGLTYLWNFGDSSPTDISISPIHTYSVTSDSTMVLNVSLTATDSNGCDSAVVKPIVISIPQAGFFAGAQNDSCPPFDALFIDSSSTDIISWSWNFGDGTSPITKLDTGAAHTYEFAGYFDVSVVATNNIGCKDTLEKDSLIRVSGPSGTFTFLIDSNRCFSDVDFIATTNNASSITWDFRDGVTDSSNIVTHRYETDGTYLPILILKDTNNCQVFIIAPDTIVISTASISVSAKPDTNNVYPENTITFSGTSSSPAPVILWEWNFGDGDTVTTTSSSPLKHKYDKPGDYKITLNITDEDGCTATFDTIVTIIEGIITSNVFTPNGDGINDVFTIKRNGMKEHYIVIFNRWGEMIYEHTSPEIQWAGKNFSGANVTDGTYYYILKSTRENGEVVENKNFITLIR